MKREVCENRSLPKGEIIFIGDKIICENIYSVILAIGTKEDFDKNINHCVDFAKKQFLKSVDKIIDKRVTKLS